MVEVDPERAEWVLGRFRRLMRELERGTFVRNTFTGWEVELLVDILSSELTGAKRWGLLRQYRRAAEKQIEEGVEPPLKFSEFLGLREEKRQRRLQVCSTRLPSTT
jgi:hypothetical protein